MLVPLLIGLYYYGEVTMKQIGAEIGVNESRVSQLHARAIRRLRDALGEMGPQQMAEMRKALLSFVERKPAVAKAAVPAVTVPPEARVKPAPAVQHEPAASAHAVVIQYKPATRRTPARQPLKVGRHRQAVAAAR
jgi:hypothetical protein